MPARILRCLAIATAALLAIGPVLAQDTAKPAGIPASELYRALTIVTGTGEANHVNMKSAIAYARRLVSGKKS